jgi:cell shape-determining protein MreC
MRSLRFIHVFSLLMILAALCAFVMPLFALPVRISESIRGNLRVLFWPVARPTHLVAGWIGGKVSPDRPHDDGAADPSNPRASQDLLRENQELRNQVGNLLGRLEQMKKLDAELASVGDVRDLCERFGVMGPSADPALREALLITATAGHGARQGTPVLYGGFGGSGIAGTLASVTTTGSTVRLVTDRGFTVNVGFARFTDDDRDGKPEFTMIATPQVQAVGDGNGAMWIRNLPMEQAKSAGLKVGDWVILTDDDWPDLLQRYRIGRITAIEPFAKGPLYAEIRVEPGTNLLKLPAVMVMNKAR